MPIIQCKFASGQRLPFLVTKARPALPLLIPLLYVQFKLRYQAYNTAARCLRSIEAFYDYASFRHVDVESDISAGRLENVLSLVSGFAAWLTTGRQATNVVAAVGIETALPMNSRTRDQHLLALKAYLSWCAARYIPRSRLGKSEPSGISAVFVDAVDSIDRRFGNHILNLKQSRAHERSLTEENIHLIRAHIVPGADINPFPERVQFHNARRMSAIDHRFGKSKK
ncbi:hypothetical protein [Chitiniphilus shinanonensis]|nr:hypothetical protein [Chitiniphilus shinanonensis]